ncbi:PREDICTED: uncharacterized protein LOC108768369 [Trachymyrmex cornetzi]|uniref:uncharacterized protein LOC108768369 n=1 Tax=Trachymyrmex cornetzi TaxID=471704 RepID=UPI00084F1180|nr:PREDICTED: uncharacterized protein LOC108768369 [Trachymyrmex cornetzi]
MTFPTEASPEEQACERLFKETTTRNCEGRFVVQLPIKPDKLKQIGNSKEVAMRHFKSLERRLIKDPKMYSDYKQFMQEYLRLGHMREVTFPTKSNDEIYYLPHHAVCKETRTTTKLRVVFDGSCKSSTGVSLNDALIVGPTIQADLFSILLRFRMFKYALTADIKQMYRQVLINSDQTSLQRIFWRDSMDEPIRTFELLTVTYGMASAAFLAIRSLRKLAEDNILKYPIGAKAVLNAFYVDDLVTGVDTLQEVSNIKAETSQLLLEGHFELRKWSSNVPMIRDNPSVQNDKEFVLSCDKECETRTLGLGWNCNTDHFKFSSIICLPPQASPTKRRILSKVALVFDPLGLLGPATVIAKIIMQNLWRLGLEWDESLPLNLVTKWRQYESGLSSLSNITIPRRVILLDEYIILELHGFADASELAYGACIYIRATDSNGTHSTTLLCSKNRVVPLKALSIPRLELCAALLLAQIFDKVSKCINHKIHAVHWWTDSTIVLAWLQSSSRTWTSFVANRVGQIHQLTAVQDWHHVNGKYNPADLLSRGISPDQLTKSQLWWSGPTWLKLDKAHWPIAPLNIRRQDIPEFKSKTIAATATTQSTSELFERYSSFTKLSRVVAYILRFFHKLRFKVKPSATSQLTLGTTLSILPDEIHHAKQVLVKMVQKSYFKNELKLLSNQQNISKTSSLLRLNPFIDDSGILRVGGRFKLSHLPYNAKYPALLPGHHPLSQLIIIHEHKRHFHAGPQATLAAIRQNYWLISARDIVRQTIRKCVTCFRISPVTTSTLMGNLPKNRITTPERPFEKCGVDYAGPFYKDGSRKGAKLLKCYIAIFVCLASTAVHIELATDLSTEVFLNVLKRFTSRRGFPSTIYSDNGLNFKGANREMNELATLFREQRSQQQIMDFASSKGINWQFIPPRAPQL